MGEKKNMHGGGKSFFNEYKLMIGEHTNDELYKQAVMAHYRQNNKSHTNADIEKLRNWKFTNENKSKDEKSRDMLVAYLVKLNTTPFIDPVLSNFVDVFFPDFITPDSQQVDVPKYNKKSEYTLSMYPKPNFSDVSNQSIPYGQSFLTRNVIYDNPADSLLDDIFGVELLLQTLKNSGANIEQMNKDGKPKYEEKYTVKETIDKSQFYAPYTAEPIAKGDNVEDSVAEGERTWDYKGNDTTIRESAKSGYQEMKDDFRKAKDGVWNKTKELGESIGNKVVTGFEVAKEGTNAIASTGKSIASSAIGKTKTATNAIANKTRKLLKDVVLYPWIREHADKVVSVAFSPDDTLILSKTLSEPINSFFVRDMATGKEILDADISSFGNNYDEHESTSTDGKKIVTQGKLITITFESKIIKLTSPSIINSINWIDETQFVYGSDDGKVRLYIIQQVTQSFDATLKDVGIKATSQDNVYVLSNKDNSKINSIAYSVNGKYIVSGSDDGNVRKWMDDFTGDPTILNNNEKNKVNSVACSADGKYVVSGANYGNVRLWDFSTVTSPDPIIFKGHFEDVTSVAISSNGKYIASGSDDCTVRVWDVNTREIFKSGYEDQGYTTWAKNNAKYGAELTTRVAKGVATGATEGAKIAANAIVDNPATRAPAQIARKTKQKIVKEYDASKYGSKQNVTKRIQKLKYQQK